MFFKKLTYLTILIILSFFVFADCQYKTNETVSVMKDVLCKANSEIIVGDALILSDFKGGNISTSFYVKNPFSYEIFVYLNYTINGFITENRENGILIQANDVAIVKDNCYDGHNFGDCHIDQESIYYHITKPQMLYKKTLPVDTQVEKCKQCSNNDCLNDGQKCTSDDQCGSEICSDNVGICAHQEILPCPSGTKICDNKCVIEGIKSYGESYGCSWECNLDLTEPINNICVKNNLQKRKELSENILNILKILGVIILISGLTFFIIKLIRNKIIEEKHHKKIQDLISEFENKKEDIEKEEKDLEIKIKQNQISATEVKKIKNKLRKERKKLSFEKNKYEKERLKVYSNKQHYKVYINKNGYEVFEDSGHLFHRWWFEHNHGRKIKPGFEIHHKNFNKRDNRIENLEELSHKEHKLKHLRRYN